jgi:fibrillarin-like pre-rRNA processing protein
MKAIRIPGVYTKGPKIYTINPDCCKGINVYGEQLRTFQGKEYRNWNPYRSKLAAVIAKKKEIALPFTESSTILYLGAATGTTVSHLSDICSKGMIYAVEPSPIAAKTLLETIQKRQNIVPIIEDANHPDRYDHFVSQVDILYMDISQRNQAEIFINNAKRYLKKTGFGILMVKARSIDVALKPTKAYAMVKEQIDNSHCKVKQILELLPFEKDHAALFITPEFRS